MSKVREYKHGVMLTKPVAGGSSIHHGQCTWCVATMNGLDFETVVERAGEHVRDQHGGDPTEVRQGKRGDWWLGARFSG